MSNNLSSLVSFSVTRENIWKLVNTTALLSSGDNAFCDTSGGTFVVQLPANPLVGSAVRLMDPNGSWPANPIDVDPQSNLLVGSRSVLAFSGSSITLIFLGSTIGWQKYNVDTPVGLALRSASDAPSARTVLGLGSISTQSANAVAIQGGTIDGARIGSITPTSGSFTGLTANTVALNDSSTNVATTAFAYGLALGNWQTISGSIALTTMPANLFVNTSSGPIGVKLPASPPNGATVVLVDAANTWSINNVQIDPNGQVLGSDTSLLVCDASGFMIRLLFNSASGWSISGMKIS